MKVFNQCHKSTYDYQSLTEKELRALERKFKNERNMLFGILLLTTITTLILITMDFNNTWYVVFTSLFVIYIDIADKKLKKVRSELTLRG